MQQASETLNFRAQQILYAVVTEYIASGEPVGSRTLAKRYALGLSAASIRNVLADLEESSYLAQPHTSAGRVPTDQGFRFFIDALMRVREVSAEDRSKVAERLQKLRTGEQDARKEIGKVLSSLTGAAAVLTTPSPDEESLDQIRFLLMREGQLLAVLVNRSGTVQNRVVSLERKLEASELERVHKYLDNKIKGHTLLEIRDALIAELKAEQGEYRKLCEQAVSIVEATLGENKGPELLIEGHEALLENPEFSDAERLRALMRTLEDKERLVELLDRTLQASGVRVTIGSETQLDSVQDLSLISANYGHEGTLGILGPKRMDYSKVVPLVGYTAKLMGELLDQRDSEG